MKIQQVQSSRRWESRSRLRGTMTCRCRRIAAWNIATDSLLTMEVLVVRSFTMFSF